MYSFKSLLPILFLWCCISCNSNYTKQQDVSNSENPLKQYFKDTTTGVKNGGIKLVAIQTPIGKFNVWTKRFGNNPRIKLLLLNGGPGATHEYFECMESYLPAEGIEFIYYDQLACGNSDNPKDTSLYSLERYVEEVEQLRVALGLDKENFYLLGHSWGGLLAMQYALKYQGNIKGLIISNMMSDAPAYGKYADDVLSKTMKPEVLDSIRLLERKKDFSNPRYMALLMEHFYSQHICRIPLNDWPEPVNRSFSKMNNDLYVLMQGPSEFGVGGKLATWTVFDQLNTIQVPTMVIGATYDTMDPEHMKKMSQVLPNGSFLLCPNGSHMCMWDDQEVYMTGLIKFLKAVDQGNKKLKF